MGDVGNRHQTNMPALVVGIGAGPHRVVVVARVFGIDGHQRNGAQIDASARIGGRGVRRLVQHFFGKIGRDAVGMNSDQADGLWRVHAADALHDPRTRKSAGAPRERFGQHQLVILGARTALRIDGKFRAALAVDRRDAHALSRHAHHAQHAMGAGA